MSIALDEWMEFTTALVQTLSFTHLLNKVLKGGVPLGYDDFLFITFPNTSEWKKIIGIVHTSLFAI